MKQTIPENSALIIVDIQNDFLPGGALAVTDGDKIIPVANQIQSLFEVVFMTQDFHPEDHESFAANHQGKSIGEVIDLHGLDQVLWPVHCVQGTTGTDFSSELELRDSVRVVKKGMNPAVDSYSGFFDNGQKEDTGLNEQLKELGVKSVFVLGLALDYCVKFTALDAKRLGFDTFLISDATRAVNLSPDDGEKALVEMEESGIHIIRSEDLIN